MTDTNGEDFTLTKLAAEVRKYDANPILAASDFPKRMKHERYYKELVDVVKDQALRKGVLVIDGFSDLRQKDQDEIEANLIRYKENMEKIKNRSKNDDVDLNIGVGNDNVNLDIAVRRP